ncbi:response regulator with CheY-like receiver [Frankia casuarinae]|uniref:Two component transcriptional regulator, winged helix family n=1 Tax=Frankia casuarinae (strain DSM 45818 / CECT 9043 / HFP020203 / CcI3) TaxID=106370 RepID=Q2J535_FRACC|nr:MULTISPECIES: response regulator transcription factor [unclassified Frankia]ABD13607.1 two component transcriptional regulator, winged helix family [Frankia casuarinae]ETA02566.1 response regulator with CheY-like receiver [Frankia sp. CcI6]EYT92749.1 response regulator with CheY-like receiver [Frankia casuarinae]KDA42069.1 response regulator with CheY-like receiver domain and winged-helix DNA-binding domain [Frankia sp. BMG5.23]KEZ35451.1 response regulator with CheY-like receiver domain an
MLPVPRGAGQPGGQDRGSADEDPAVSVGPAVAAVDPSADGRRYRGPSGGPRRRTTGTGPGSCPALLIADEDVDDGMLDAFVENGVEVSVVADGALALLEIGLRHPAALLISARLPVVDGVTVVRTVRSVPGHDDVPILLAVGPDDRPRAAAGLDAGASACVGKPYRVPEVLAMVGFIGIGRAGTYPPRMREPEVLRGGRVQLDRAAHEVRLDGAVVPVPPREFRLLALLLEQAGRVVPRETLLREVWGSAQTETNTLAVHVRRLRRRLGETAGQPTVIESIRGVGYRFRAVPDPG